MAEENNLPIIHLDKENSDTLGDFNILPHKEIISGGIITYDDGTNDVNVLDNKINKSPIMSISSDLPSSYNADLNNMKYVSEVKNQGALGTCWSFAAEAAMEALLMKKDGVEKLSSSNKDKYDLSEMHMVYALSNKFLEDGQYGFTKTINDGGNFAEAEAYMTRSRDEEKNIYDGPVYEKDFPYKDDDSYTDADINEKIKSERLEFVPSAFSNLNLYQTLLSDEQLNARNEIIKKSVIENGAVPVSVYCGSTAEEQNAGFESNSSNTKTLFYENDPANIPNHGVTIVGYDDNISASEFNVFSLNASANTYPAAPKHNGAFIVKNSWGTDWGNNGFFYMSYDTNIPTIGIYSNIASNDDYDNLYDYTPYGMQTAVNGYYYENEEFCSRITEFNSFYKKHKYTTEYLTKVGVWIPVGGEYVRFYLSKNPDVEEDASFDNVFEPIEVNTINDDTVREGDYIRVDKPGYYIFELTAPKDTLFDDGFLLGCNFAMKQGTPISDTNYYTQEYFVPAEMSIDGINVNTESESYVYSYDNSYFEESYWDICLKAYTTESVTVTINDSENVSVPYGGTLNYDKTLYYIDESDETGHTYKEYDKNTSLTSDISLYTADYIGTSDIVLTQQDGRQISDSSYYGTRVVGEIDKDIANAKLVTELGFTAYKDSKPVAVEGQTPYVFKDIYEEIDDYTKKDENTYLIMTPTMNKNDVDSVAFFGKFVIQNDEEITVNYITKKFVNN